MCFKMNIDTYRVWIMHLSASAIQMEWAQTAFGFQVHLGSSKQGHSFSIAEKKIGIGAVIRDEKYHVFAVDEKSL